MSTYNNGQPQGGQRAPGARREKVRGYLKAANELRHSYQTQLSQRMQENEQEGRIPGDFPDVEIVRSGNEEMLLFPSYARKHVKVKKHREHDAYRSQPGAHDHVDRPVSSGDQDYWKREWEKFEDENAIVDVDVRGWIYTPQRGPLNRKNRLIVAVARRLSGVPAPLDPTAGSREVSPTHMARRGENDLGRGEEAAALREAEEIAKRGEKEADRAWRGSYGNGGGSAATSRNSSPVGLRRTHTGDLTDPGEDEDPGNRPITKRDSWNHPSNMNNHELNQANDLLLTRLKPFMTSPLAHTTITVFFFNKHKSLSKSVTTNDSGHFNVRAALDFVPTQVRVLASENLSATEDVIITDHRGVSLISDIDDTIKHSAIASGAREIFKNTFVRELHDLTIKGVKEWYTTMASMGVQMHYVSNSPWQLFPLLKNYFALAGLPPGSFHLKQYSGMLQGIFEPAAERKKGSIERILGDFPERRFILVGDSGEADLEVYTDAVLTYPGRILAVFIRDVTTPIQKGFFDQSMWHPDSKIDDKAGEHLWESRPDDAADLAEKRPSLPSRSMTEEPANLIDFSDDVDSPAPHEVRTTSYADELQSLNGPRKSSAPEAPNKPNKPSNLRSFTTQSPTPTHQDKVERKSVPTKGQDGDPKKPPPPKPRRLSTSVDYSSESPRTLSSPNPLSTDRASTSSTASARDDPIPLSRTNTNASLRSTNSIYSTSQDEGYLTSARRQINNAYNALPAVRSQSPTRQSAPGSDAPPPPPRRGLSSYPAAAARWATGANLGDPAAGGDGGANPYGQYNKKEEMWKRRWARAEEIMRHRGVVLRSWRNGSDVMAECVKLVEKAKWEEEGLGRRGGRSS